MKASAGVGSESSIVAYTHDAEQKELTMEKDFELDAIVNFIWMARYPLIAPYTFR